MHKHVNKTGAIRSPCQKQQHHNIIQIHPCYLATHNVLLHIEHSFPCCDWTSRIWKGNGPASLEARLYLFAVYAVSVFPPAMLAGRTTSLARLSHSSRLCIVRVTGAVGVCWNSQGKYSFWRNLRPHLVQEGSESLLTG